MAGRKPSQRERLVKAMVVVAGRHGYGGATVDRVIAQAGVSRATFYQHFGDRSDCFLAAYRETRSAIASELSRVADESALADRPEAALATLMAAADKWPHQTRFILLEALGAAPEIRAEHEKFLERVEAAIDAYLTAAAEEGRQLEIPPRALLGAIVNVISVRLFRGDTGGFGDLGEGLQTWIGRHLVPAGSVAHRDQDAWNRLGEGLQPVAMPGAPGGDQEERAPLPRGRGALPRSVAAQEHRVRILDAVARVTTEKGYMATSVADIVAAAGVSREAFYEQFRGKEDAFLSAQALGLQESIAHAAGAYFGSDTWIDQVWLAIKALLSYVGSVPDHAYVGLFESFAAGEAAIRREFDMMMSYTLFLEAGYHQSPEADALPRVCSEAIGGAVKELMRRQLARKGAERMIEVAPQCAYVVIAPFLGASQAVEIIEAKVAEEGRAPR